MRKEKWFYWADDDTMKVKEVLGYQCNGQPDVWWVPAAGFTMFTGRHLFNSKIDALNELLRQAKVKKGWYESAIIELTAAIEAEVQPVGLR